MLQLLEMMFLSLSLPPVCPIMRMGSHGNLIRISETSESARGKTKSKTNAERSLFHIFTIDSPSLLLL